MNKKIIIAFLIIMSMTTTKVSARGYWGGWGYGVGLGYGLGWGYPGWGWGGYWGYPGWGWGGYWGYPYYGYNYSRRAEEDAYYAERARDASLRAQQAEERIRNVNRRRKLRQNNPNRSQPPHRYQTRTLPY